MTNVKVTSGELVDTTWLNTLARGAYRKVSPKQVLNSVAETDLFNAEIAIAAGAMGTNGLLRITAWGDYVQNSGAPRDVPRFKLKLGGTTLFDTNVLSATVIAASASRKDWFLRAMVMNTAAGAQSSMIDGEIDLASLVATFGTAAFVTGEGSTGTVMRSTTQAGEVNFSGVGTSAVDTTALAALVLSVINPTATATMDTTLLGALIEVI